MGKICASIDFLAKFANFAISDLLPYLLGCMGVAFERQGRYIQFVIATNAWHRIWSEEECKKYRILC